MPEAEPSRGPSRRRGRPRREDGPAVTREAILDAAVQSVRNHGLRGLALREIARRLGVSLPTIQQHFPTRDELWRACVDRVTTDRLAMLEALPGAGLVDVLREQLERTTLAPGWTAAMWHDPEAGAAGRLDYLEAKVKPVIRLAQSRIEAAIAAGAARPVDPAVLTALMGLGLGSLTNAPEALRRLFDIDLDDPADRERFVDALADILLNGLIAQRQAEGWPAAPSRSDGRPSRG